MPPPERMLSLRPLGTSVLKWHLGSDRILNVHLGASFHFLQMSGVGSWLLWVIGQRWYSDSLCQALGCGRGWGCKPG